jgi:hypothetical protein
MRNKHLIPKIHPHTASLSYVKTAWRNFAQRITKNIFVKQFLKERDGDNCQWCFNSLKMDCIIHHTSYDHSCTFNKTIIIGRPTEKRPDRKAEVPDCELCKREDETRFLDCMKHLALVHSGCNWTISKISNKYYPDVEDAL